MRENLVSDVEAYTKALENNKKDLEHYKEQYELQDKIWNNISKPGQLRKLEPVYQFQLDDEYWRLQELKQANDIKLERKQAEATIKQLESVVEGSIEALKNAKEKLERFGGDKEEVESKNE
jgi:hypothetical protein